jgi:periplasmic protein TonB
MADSMFNNWGSVVAPVRNDIVFEDKNKLYGAYELRKNHNRTVALALLISSVLFVFAVSLPAIIEWIQNNATEQTAEVDITDVILTPPPPIDETVPPPPPPPPPPVMETVKFTPPVVTDEEVIEEPPPVQQEEQPQISTETQEGKGDQDIIVPTEGNDALGDDKTIYTFVEENPEFPGGGFGAMQKWLQANLKYPQLEKEANISGTVHLEFIVDKEGKISEVKILKGVSGGPGLDKEALRVVKLMPAWKPGKMNGRPVIVRYRIPIKFSLGG